MSDFQSKLRKSLPASRWAIALLLTVGTASSCLVWLNQSTEPARNALTSRTQSGALSQPSQIDERPLIDSTSQLSVADIPTYPQTTLVAFQEPIFGNQPRRISQQHQANYPQQRLGNSQVADYSQPTSSPLKRQVTTARFDDVLYDNQPGPIDDAFGYTRPNGNPQYNRQVQYNRPLQSAQMQPVHMQPVPMQTGPMQPMAMQPQFSASIHGSGNCDCNQCSDCLPQAPAFKSIMAVDGYRRNPNREPRWGDADLLPWESLAYGEYIGPVRTPHLREYRVRVGDQLDFTFRQTREITQQAYRLGVGDEISINSGGDFTEFNDDRITVLRDGTIQLRGIGNVLAANKTLERLQSEINQLYQEDATNVSPKMIIKVIKSETQLNDLIRTVDATAGQGGQFRTLTVSPDGTVQLPALGSVPAIGLSLDELGAEANARYAMLVQGLEVTPSLRTSAPTFAYVLGEANNPGRIQLDQPTTVMQLIAQAGGWRNGANLREIVVFRRDENWRLVATKLDLAAPLFGNAPHPSDDLWIRNNDIVLLPKTPAQRVADFVEIYFQRGLYGVFPSQGFSVNFDGISSL